MNKKLAEKIKTLPRSPGVYFHKSADGEVIYVGKAAVLRNRVKQYFQSKKDMDAKTLVLVNEIADIDWIETDSEIDALFLESEMIKRYKPRFNILLRDDKSATYIRINMRDAVPYVSFTRQPIDDGAEYFGPFYSGVAVKKAMRLLRKVFPYYDKPTLPKRAGLAYQIGLTPGIEAGKMTEVEYKKTLRQLISYIRGNRKVIVRDIEKSMNSVARRQRFETATHYRNQLNNLRELQRQVVFGREEFLDISKDKGLIGLRDLLGLPKVPRRIEGYDISHHGGKNNVASMVVTTNGIADKAQYRKFKLQVPGNDDTAHMREALTRRLKHLKDWGYPDLIVIDGGAGQLSAVADVLNAEKIPFVGRNKSGNHGRNAGVQLVIPRGDNYETVMLGHDSHVAKLIARIDDESHRFAISYHTHLKRAGATKNVLEEIPGIGPVTRKKLIRKFGSLVGIKKASEKELAEVVGASKAKILFKQLFLIK